VLIQLIHQFRTFTLPSILASAIHNNRRSLYFGPGSKYFVTLPNFKLSLFVI